jgi:hypothetical protein
MFNILSQYLPDALLLHLPVLGLRSDAVGGAVSRREGSSEGHIIA